MTDNGSAYVSFVHALACRALGIKHLRTRPYRPRTNGKAERFIRTLLGGWAYGASTAPPTNAAPRSPAGSTSTIADDPTGSLSHQAPTTRLHALMNNPLGSHN